MERNSVGVTDRTSERTEKVKCSKRPSVSAQRRRFFAAAKMFTAKSPKMFTAKSPENVYCEKPEKSTKYMCMEFKCVV